MMMTLYLMFERYTMRINSVSRRKEIHTNLVNTSMKIVNKLIVDANIEIETCPTQQNWKIMLKCPMSKIPANFFPKIAIFYHNKKIFKFAFKADFPFFTIKLSTAAVRM